MPSADRSRKYTSPPPPPATMTPPPSSSKQASSSYPARTPTPTHSHLSSPPPTIKASAARHRANLLDAETGSTSSDNESATDVEQLRNMLAAAREECIAAKTAAAHYRFQLELVSFESSECIKRMEVEMEMTAREIDVLRQVESPPTPALAPAELAVLEWKNRCMLLEGENDNLRARLANAKALIVEREDQNAEQTDKLRQRIRENRLRLNQLRSSGTLFGEVLPSYDSPRRERLEKPYAVAPSPIPRADDPFSNLLLADQVLRSQEAASTPSTPMGSRQRGHAHVRGQHSLASLPSTPYRSAPRSQPAQHYRSKAPLAVSALRDQRTSNLAGVQHQRRRRQSRDSTISASEMGEDENAGDADSADRVPDSEAETEEGYDDVAVPASQASQEAAEMLRRSTSIRHQQQQHYAAPPTKSLAAGGQSFGYQMAGAATGKAGQGGDAAKHRFYDDVVDEQATKPRKKARGIASSENIGLGLGLDVGGPVGTGAWMGAR